MIVEDLGRVFLINLDKRPDRLNLFAGEAKKIGFSYERISAVEGGASGATASHLKVAAIARDSKSSHYTVFEDDAQFADNTIELLKDVALPEVWDIIFLGGSYGFFTPYTKGLLRITDSLALHGMMVSNRFYNKFIELLSNTSEPCDVILNRAYQQYRVFGFYPILCWQREGMSDITGKFENYDRTLRKTL